MCRILTGRKRYRVGFFGKVILQVEVQRVAKYSFVSINSWEDAEITDITQEPK